jgi:hypothetical protein
MAGAGGRSVAPPPRGKLRRMVRAISANRSAPVRSLAWATLGVLGSLAAAACSSSSSSGKTSDGGDDSVSYVTPETGLPDDGGGGGGDASDGPSCNIPAGATYSYDAGPIGGFSCTPIGPDPMCDAKSYLVRCLASDPSNNPPMLTSSLHCGTSMPTSMSAETEWCCACQ